MPFGIPRSVPATMAEITPTEEWAGQPRPTMHLVDLASTIWWLRLF